MHGRGQLNKLKLKRTQLRDRVGRFQSYLNETFPRQPDVLELGKRLRNIELTLDEFDDCQGEIELYDSSSDHSQERLNFENNYYSIISRAQGIINDSQPVDQNPNANRVSTINTPTHLPSLALPKFKGNYNEYTYFRETFNSLIDKNISLAKIQKFHYLVSSLEGDALNLIKSLEITENNYEVAWSLLKGRYENNRVIINSHIQALFELTNISKENSHALRHFVDTVNKHVRALESLEQKVSAWDSILIYLLSSKLDFNSKRDWESKVKLDTLPTFKQFLEFLNNRAQLLENVYMHCSQDKIHHNKSDTHKYNKSTNHIAIEKQYECYFCKKNHFIYHCQEFLKLSPIDRTDKVKGLKLCLNCLKPNITGHSCNGDCRKCHRKHNTLLHFQKTKFNTATTQQDSSKATADLENKNGVSINAYSSHLNDSLTLLGTAKLLIRNYEGQFIECRALLDGGSQSNFATSRLAEQLKLKASDITFPISGIGQIKTNITKRVYTQIRSKHNNFSENLTFLVIDRITGDIPHQTFDASEIKIPSGITLADPKFNEVQKIDLLLGASVFYKLLSVGQIRLDRDIILQNSRLGWLVTGSYNSHQSFNNVATCLFSVNDGLVQEQLEKFWSLEEIKHIPQATMLTKEEMYCENHFKENLKRDKNGRFTVSLPFKDSFKNICNNVELAINRFLNLERKLSRDPKLRESYINFMREYEHLGHMSKLNDDQVNTVGDKYYFPHHGVLKPSSNTTKLRVVFDASAKGPNNLSFNDVACVGPTIQDDIFTILARFRKHNFVLKADITKMYRQVNVEPSQRDLQRILWRENIDQELAHYRLNTVTYGTAPAAFLAIRSLQQTALDNFVEFPEASRVILSDFYVDDLITGANTVHELRTLKYQLFHILSTYGFVLTQFKSNDRQILDSYEHQEIVQLSDDDTSKTLGILWNPNRDSFQFNINIKLHTKTLTKRIILSMIGKIFDPLGILGPVIVKAKLILQNLWKLRLQWDEPIQAEYNDQFLLFFQGLLNLDELSVPRKVMLPCHSEVQLHGFADASEIAYGACVYMRTVNTDGSILVALLCSKSRVAPIKSISLPRLELCAALLLSILVDKVKKALRLDNIETYFWTDSEIVLAWIAKEPSHWKTFIMNRVSEIQNLTEISKWNHVQSADNPADIISRGSSVLELMNSELWWSGPQWLSKEQVMPYNTIKNKTIEAHELLEARKPKKLICLVISNNFDLFHRYSNYNRLIRITALCLRFINNIKSNCQNRIKDNIQVFEIKRALNVLIKTVQSAEFCKEISDLKTKGHVSKKSKLLDLNVFLDDDQILRVGGRLVNSNLSYCKKYQILLPNKHVFTDCIIRYEHEKTLHGGVQTTLSSIRSSFWPINAKNNIKKIIRQCVACFKAKPTNFNPLMGDLPEARIVPTQPFHSVGIDFAGPFLVKESTLRNRKLVKAYICLFICFSTKAIHLELVGDLSTPAFLNTLKRFFARRGVSKFIWSDNGTNFVGAANRLNDCFDQLIKLTDDPLIQNYLTENHVCWKFIPPRAPHFGGLWESAVKLAKHHLVRAIGLSNLTYENFLTLLAQVESVLNSRPIMPMSNDPDDLEPLTPAHFLIGCKLTSIPEENVEQPPADKRNKYKQLQHISQIFWRRWSAEYLHNLQQRHKWMLQDENILKPGLMVLLREDNTPPLNWKIGRIIELHPGKDHVTRVVTIKTPSGVLKRATNKICVFPIEH